MAGINNVGFFVNISCKESIIDYIFQNLSVHVFEQGSFFDRISCCIFIAEGVIVLNLYQEIDKELLTN